ncbi:Xaa-Pro dipeptidyl-peptidase, partial [Streptomyces sp. NPDC127044]
MPKPARRMRFTTWRSLATAATAALMAVFLAPAAAHGAPRESTPVYSYENAIRESVWVDTGLDGDGHRQTLPHAGDIRRPPEHPQHGPHSLRNQNA